MQGPLNAETSPQPTASKEVSPHNLKGLNSVNSLNEQGNGFSSELLERNAARLTLILVT